MKVLDAAAHKSQILGELRESLGGSDWCHRLTDVADKVLAHVFEKAVPGASVAIVAVGGYGREELASGSDLDITFIPLDQHDPSNEEIVRALFKETLAACEALDWPVAYAYRLPSDAPALDHKTRTGLLDARFVAGERRALDQFLEIYRSSFPIAEFLISKFEERRARRAKWHDTPRVVEFNVMEGAGGLREFQAARWFERVLDLEPAHSARESHEFLLTLRNALHSITGRKEDRLLRTRSAAVAEAFGVDIPALHAMAMEAGEAIAADWEAVGAKARRASFPLSGPVRAENGICLVPTDATLADAAVAVSRASELGIEIGPCAPAGGIGDAPMITACLTGGERAVRALDKAGVLGAALPELGDVLRLLPRDTMHEYSVGEHSIRLVAELDRMRGSHEYDAAFADVVDPRILYLSALLHDLGKIEPNRPHSEVGAEIAAKVCERLKLGESETAAVVWLVREHLTMAKIARTHDLGHPAASLELARICGRQDRLSMLYLLTIADIGAVGDAWTPQMASSLRDIYRQTRAAIGLEAVPSDAAVYRSAALRKVQSVAVDPNAEKLLETMPTHYLLATPKESFPLHSHYLARALGGETVVEFHNQPDMGTTAITVCRLDLPEPGLLSRILGVIYAFDASLHGLRAASTTKEPPIALDVCATSFRGAPLPAGLSSLLAEQMQTCLEDTKKLDELLAVHGKDPAQPQEMFSYRYFEGDLGVLEVETPLGRGMPFRVTKMLAGFGWNVHVARIGQWAGRAVGRFYLDLPQGPLSAQAVAFQLGKPLP